MKNSRLFALSALALTATTLIAVDMTDAKSEDHYDSSIDFQALQARSRELVSAQEYRDDTKKALDSIVDEIAVSIEDHGDFFVQTDGVILVSTTTKQATDNLESLGQLFHEGSQANYVHAIAERDVEILSMALARSWMNWSENQ